MTLIEIIGIYAIGCLIAFGISVHQINKYNLNLSPVIPTLFSWAAVIVYILKNAIDAFMVLLAIVGAGLMLLFYLFKSAIWKKRL